MTIRLNGAAKMFAKSLCKFQEVFKGGTISMYSGVQPDTADDGPIGCVLCEAEIPGFAVRQYGTYIPLAGTADIDLVGLDTSTLGWFRIHGNKNTAGVFASLDGAIGSRHKDCDIEMVNRCIIAGEQITMESITIDLSYLEE